jgi:hypothetical protein
LTLSCQSYVSFVSPSQKVIIPESSPKPEKASLTTTHIPWASLPPKLWSSGQYMSGLPRICLPNVVNDKISADDPSPTTNWKKDQRAALQRSLDSGQLKILPRPFGMSHYYPASITLLTRFQFEGRNVLFEVLDPDGSLSDTDCGLSDSWKFEHMIPPKKEKRSHKRKAARESQPKAQVPLGVPSISW